MDLVFDGDLVFYFTNIDEETPVYKCITQTNDGNGKFCGILWVKKFQNEIIELFRKIVGNENSKVYVLQRPTTYKSVFIYDDRDDGTRTVYVQIYIKGGRYGVKDVEIKKALDLISKGQSSGGYSATYLVKNVACSDVFSGGYFSMGFSGKVGWDVLSGEVGDIFYCLENNIPKPKLIGKANCIFSTYIYLKYALSGRSQGICSDKEWGEFCGDGGYYYSPIHQLTLDIRDEYRRGNFGFFGFYREYKEPKVDCNNCGKIDGEDEVNIYIGIVASRNQPFMPYIKTGDYGVVNITKASTEVVISLSDVFSEDEFWTD